MVFKELVVSSLKMGTTTKTYLSVNAQYEYVYYVCIWLVKYNK